MTFKYKRRLEPNLPSIADLREKSRLASRPKVQTILVCMYTHRNAVLCHPNDRTRWSHTNHTDCCRTTIAHSAEALYTNSVFRSIQRVRGRARKFGSFLNPDPTPRGTSMRSRTRTAALRRGRPRSSEDFATPARHRTCRSARGVVQGGPLSVSTSGTVQDFLRCFKGYRHKRPDFRDCA